ncbi:MAG: peptide chain release factor 1 [Planctomycetales bacterium 4484_113]|nr:MAG: peptide chain release factor 1 [Planctomycetales bacterium 4484_113]
MGTFEEKLAQAEAELKQVSGELARPEIVQNHERYAELSRRFAHLRELHDLHTQLQELDADIAKLENDCRELKDEDLRQLARDELAKARAHRQGVHDRIQFKLMPPDPNDTRDVILELRAGTGGDEAALFAAEMLRMYTRFAEKMNWQVEVLHLNEIGIGGIKEGIIAIKGTHAYSHLKYERGVHRVQRVPVTESGGRIHTSTITVAVLPEADDVEVRVDEKDLRVDTFRASGAGGQHVNKTSSAIRITHLPTGLVVTCQDERSQFQNREKAMRILRAHLLQRAREQQQQEITEKRRRQVGSGERSEKIRTYNFPQDRITDHRLKENLHNLPELMKGELLPLIEKLKAWEAAQISTED